MKFRWVRLACLAALPFLLLPASLAGQFKRVYVPDTTYLQDPSLFTTAKVLLTDVPGREVAVVGSITARDTTNFSHQAVYNLLFDTQGQPQAIHVFDDTSQFVFQSPRAYAACYDGAGEFYMGIGANSRQVVMKTNAAGQMLWARAGNHHEYYSMVCEGGTVAFLGQDESIQGAHDFSLARLDANGAGSQGNMFGTPEFELPQKLVKAGGTYLLGGSSRQGGSFKAALVKADAGLNQVWGRVYQIDARALYMYGLAEAPDGSGYFLSGRAMLPGADSILVMKTDTAGGLLWARLYGLQGATECSTTAMTVDPIDGGCIVSGYYRGLSYNRPFMFKVDAQGTVLWAREYADRGKSNDEVITDVVYSAADSMLYAAGDMVEIDSNQYLQRIFLLKVPAETGTNPCDSALAIGSAPTTLTQVGTMVEEPFLANSAFPMGNIYGAGIHMATRCAVMVGVAPVAATGRFQIQNPSDGRLHVWVDVPAGGGRLSVVSVTGELLHEARLEAGPHDHVHDMPQLSSGIYLVRLAGEGWRYETLRWVVQR